MSHWFCFWIQVVSTSSSESTSCASSFRMTVPVRQWKNSWPGVKYSALPACATAKTHARKQFVSVWQHEQTAGAVTAATMSDKAGREGVARR